VSADGGGPPERLGPSGHFHAHAWSPAGDLIAVDVNASRLVEFAPRDDAEPRPEDGFRIYRQPPSYDVSADGRFVTPRSEAVPAISVLLNWPGLFRPASGD